MKNDDKYLVVLLIYVYILVAQIFTLYFWYEYSQDHNFIETLFIGPIIGEIKGLLFPFFLPL
jgi:hypothetical protein